LRESELPPATFSFTQAELIPGLHVRPGEIQSQMAGQQGDGLDSDGREEAKTFLFRAPASRIRASVSPRSVALPVNPVQKVGLFDAARKEARRLEVRMDKGEDPTLDDPTPDENTTAASGDVVSQCATFPCWNAMNFYVQWNSDNEKSAATITHR